MKLEGRIRFSRTIERRPSDLRLRRGRERWGTHMVPCSLRRREEVEVRRSVSMAVARNRGRAMGDL